MEHGPRADLYDGKIQQAKAEGEGLSPNVSKNFTLLTLFEMWRVYHPLYRKSAQGPQKWSI